MKRSSDNVHGAADACKRRKLKFLFFAGMTCSEQGKHAVKTNVFSSKEEAAQWLADAAIPILERIYRDGDEDEDEEECLANEVKRAVQSSQLFRDSPTSLLARLKRLTEDYNVPMQLYTDKFVDPDCPDFPGSVTLVTREVLNKHGLSGVPELIFASVRSVFGGPPEPEPVPVKVLKTAIACQARLVLDKFDFALNSSFEEKIKALTEQGAGFSPETDSDGDDDGDDDDGDCDAKSNGPRSIESSPSLSKLSLAFESGEVVSDQDTLEMLNEAMNLPNGAFSRVVVQRFFL